MKELNKDRSYYRLSRVSTKISVLLSLMLLLIFISCENNSPTESSKNLLTKVSGDGQTGAPGDTLSVPLEVLVTDKNGKAVTGQWIEYKVIEGSATLSDTLVVTDDIGKARAVLILGGTEGEIKVEAKLYNTDVITVFTAFASTYTISGTVRGANNVTITISGDAAENQVVNDNEKYSFHIEHGRNYTITPSITGYTFTPIYKSFSNVAANQTQDFTALIIQYSLTMAVNQSGWGTTIPPVGEHIYDYGTVVEIRSIPAEGYQFANWTGDVDSTTSSSTITMLDNKTVTAIFEVMTFTISGTITDADGVTVTLSGDDNLTETTDAQGLYSFTVSKSGSYTVIPSKLGYTFNPSSQSFSNLTSNKIQNFKGIKMLTNKIVFRAMQNNNIDIYLMSADSPNLIRLTTNSSSEESPSWSPDGSKIAFTSRRDVNRGTDIYVMYSDGTNQTRITNNSVNDDSPSWSPDGSKIAFSSSRDSDYDPEIFVMDANGTNQIQLTNSSDNDQVTGSYEPSWSPDGSKIACASNRDGRGSSKIYVMNTDGTNQTRITNNLSYDLEPSWSPDGSKIAFSSNINSTPDADIYVMNTDGTNQTRLTNNSGDDLAPSWSPDGSKIAFTSNRDGNWEIYVMYSDGTNQIQLTNSSYNDQVTGSYEPSWSPF